VSKRPEKEEAHPHQAGFNGWISMKSEGIKNKIIQYLISFPHAQDSIEGIARWWVEGDENEVESVITELVHEKILQKREVALKSVYGLTNPANKE
jgi:hypothetical protein